MTEVVPQESDIPKTKVDIDIFSFGGLIPILNTRDVIDVINHLQGYLHKIGVIVNMDEYKDSLERFIEGRGKMTGNLQVVEYNLDDDENLTT